MRRRARRSRPVARRSSASGGSSIAPSPTAWRKRGSGSSPSRGCRPANGAACAPPTRSSGCPRSSNVGSRRRPCCRRPTLRLCCSGHCSLRDRSTCARSMAGKRSPPNHSFSQLTSPLDQIASMHRRLRRVNSNHIPDGTTARSANALLQRFGILFGVRFVVIYVEPIPEKGQLLTTNTARTTLLLDNEKLPWEDWAYEFRENMPKRLAQFVNEKAAALTEKDHISGIKDRLK